MTLTKWDINEQMVAILSRAADNTNTLEGSRYVTISLVLPLIGRLIQELQSDEVPKPWSPTDSFRVCDLHPAVARARTKMRIDYEARWMTNLPLETIRMLCIATQLDPRFKAWKFKGVWRDRKEQALKWLKDEHAAHWKPSPVGHPMTPQSTSSKASKKPSKKHKSVTELLSSDEESADDVPDVRDVDFEAANDVMARDELMMYLSEPPLAKEADVLEWWRLNRAKYPSVALMARCVAQPLLTTQPPLLLTI